MNEDDNRPTAPPSAPPLPPGWNGSAWTPPTGPPQSHGYGGYRYLPWDPPPPPPAPGRSRRLMVASLGVLAALVGGSAAAAVVANRHSSTFTPTQLGLSTGPGPSLPTAAPNGTQDVPTRVDPAIVDITTQLGQSGVAAGTGMVLTSGGIVLTNNHVIDGATSIKVQIGGTGPTASATVVGYDHSHDVAVLQITHVSGLATVQTGDSSSVTVGQSVMALGNALGQGGTPTVAQGTVTALDQTITATDNGGGNAETLHGLIEMNAPIQPGDSGGPLVDANAKVIGMTTAASSATRRGLQAGDGYAIPINAALSIARQIQAGHGSSTIQIGTRGILGVDVRDSSTPAGALVGGTISGGPAAAAGLVAGDVVVAVNGAAIGSSADLSAAMVGRHPGDRVDLSWVDQSGQTQTATIQLVAGPPS